MASHPKLLKKEGVKELLHSISREYSVFVPANKDGFVTFEEFNKSNFLRVSYSNYYIPPAKGFLFPPNLKNYINSPWEDAWLQPGKKALYGVRPCDAQSLVLLDKAVKDNEFYTEKRENIFIIVEGCNDPLKTCFCTLVNGSPFSSSGADIFITDAGDNFIAEDISGRGTEYLSDLDCAGNKDLLRKEEIAAKSINVIGSSFNIDGIPGILERADKIFESNGTWEMLGMQCSNCALCTAICPTCHCCFVIEDVIEMVCEEIGDEAKNFDPCILNIILSGGLASAPKGYQRLQRRLMDKFCRTMKSIGQPFCVGCGRCTTACSNNIDLKEILSLVIEKEAKIR
ncbi:MAG: 4Fe-4S dicluster domain-containing protein [Nitrospirae bacterium]|nr:4Fe-4S dicluster domain-containing protein [Nitrospirota bacterium]